MTLALDGPSAWVACKEQSRLVRVDTRTGRTLRSLRLTAPVIAVATGYGSVWAVDTSSTLYRIRGGKVAKRIPLFARAAYNVWLGGGSVWVADDQGAEVIRVSPASNKVVAHVAVGDGPASMAFAPGRAWVMSHRDRTLQRIALDTNAVTRLATLGGDDAAPERMVYAQGSLWITGRGADLLRVDPETGAVQSTTEIGASGIDLVAGGGELWVPARNATVDQTGFPTMSALRIVSPAGSALDFFTPSGRFDVHGLAVGQGSVWLADNTRGRLYSFPLVCGNLARLDALGRAPAPKPEEAAAASAAAGAVAPAAIRRDAATLAGYYRAVASGGLPARDAAAVAATRLGRWSAGACPRAYDVL
jgi:streptogramin lyase